MSKFVIREVPTGVKFDLIAANGEAIGTSQVYANKTTCKEGINSVRKVAVEAKTEDQTVENWEKVTNPKFQIYVDHAGEPRFRLIARNGEEILASQAYTTKEACKKGIASVIKNAPDAGIEE